MALQNVNTIASLADFKAFISEYPEGRKPDPVDLTMYRGQRSDRSIIPLIARGGKYNPVEEKESITKYIAVSGEVRLFCSMALMQHSRILATRLMDWTIKPEVALYFAIHGKPSKPVIWKYVAAGHHQVGKKSQDGRKCTVETLDDKYDVEDLRKGGLVRWPVVFNPADITGTDSSLERLGHQGSRFVVAPLETSGLVPMDKNKRLLDHHHLCKGEIELAAVPELNDHLENDYTEPINAAFVYPDLPKYEQDALIMNDLLGL